MTFIWLVVWLLFRTPDVELFGPWNDWGVALAVCAAIDLLGALKVRPRSRRRSRT
ncbi:hypothetical protein GCM10009557_31690 [Virgisporangium ochraceum]|uniref:Uncharacterized protein n=1 Tax=Virgisporangium ochraceum TaxID=65505 RepID=A0A8J3ZYI4_9ACTN|nr:hypothetical protein [Virgisporangium ochraceum]GIJ71583.1 hypothetical protein Voc01_065000 [Virgisporangium ochraceum]